MKRQNMKDQADFLRDVEPDDALRPLADRMRPRTLDEFVGQQQVIGAGKPLRQALERGQLHSLILWGPPGTGKTTLARLIARHADAEFMQLSDRKSTRLNSSHLGISYAVFCLKKKKKPWI